MNMIGNLNSHDLTMSKTSFDCAHIEKIAKAAAIELTPELKEQLRSDLQRVEDVLHPMAAIEVCPTKKTDFRICNYFDLADDNHTQSSDKHSGSCWQYFDDSTGYFTVPKVLNNDT